MIINQDLIKQVFSFIHCSNNSFGSFKIIVPLMYSILNWILDSESTNLASELYITFGFIIFIVINLLITIYSREFSEEFEANYNPDLWIKRRCRASGQSIS